MQSSSDAPRTADEPTGRRAPGSQNTQQHPACSLFRARCERRSLDERPLAPLAWTLSVTDSDALTWRLSGKLRAASSGGVRQHRLLLKATVDWLSRCLKLPRFLSLPRARAAATPCAASAAVRCALTCALGHGPLEFVRCFERLQRQPRLRCAVIHRRKIANLIPFGVPFLACCSQAQGAASKGPRDAAQSPSKGAEPPHDS